MDISTTFRKWWSQSVGVGSRSDSSPETSPEIGSAKSERRPNTPFKRSRSKVFLSPEGNDRTSMSSNSMSSSSLKSPFSTSALMNNVRKSRHREVFGSSPDSNITNFSTPLTRSFSCSQSLYSSNSRTELTPSPFNQGLRESTIQEVPNEHIYSEEMTSKIQCSLIDSPEGSLRGSPSHRSQDSGYSDSGESHTQNDSDEASSPPQVKHITRVYFGDLSNQTKLYNDKIVCTPDSTNNYLSNKALKQNRRKSTSVIGDYYHHEEITPNRKSLSPSTSSLHSHHQDEPDHIVEHKSISPETSKNTVENKKFKGILRNSKETETRFECLPIEEQRKTGAIKKTSIFSTGWGRKHLRRCKSSDKVSEVERPKRNVILKAKRRWSTIDLRQKFQKDDYKKISDEGITNSRVFFYDDHFVDNQSIKEERIEKKLRIHPLAIAMEMKNSSLEQWVMEARVVCETECMNTLQSKSLATSSKLSAGAARDAVVAIQRRAHSVSAEFARLCQRLENDSLEDINQLSMSLVDHITNFLEMHIINQHQDQQTSFERQRRVVEQICKSLLENSLVTDSPQESESSPKTTTKTSTQDIIQLVTALGHAFTKLVDILLSQEIKILVSTLEDGSQHMEIRSAISHLTALGVDGGHLCRLISRLGGVRALLGIVLDPHFRHVRVAALRALATVCCVVEGIVQLEKTGGIEVVSEVLCDNDAPEEERSEAAAVIAQITSPWVEDNHVLVWLHPQTSAIISALTDLARHTESAEIFLLSTAALANLTFLDSSCVEEMQAAGTPQVLLTACTEGRNMSIFTKDQIATVLANLSGNEHAAGDVVAHGGVGVLITLLHIESPDTSRVAEVAAAERVQQKSAIALSRLCSKAEVAKSTLELGGVERLVELCKNEEERNHSDAVLVACLSALRKLSSSCGKDLSKDLNASELLEPRLLDSFLIYSSKQESYV